MPITLRTSESTYRIASLRNMKSSSDFANFTSTSPVMPFGSNSALTNFDTNVSSGTPYCRPTETAVANASMTPESVEPSLPICTNSSPSPPSSYSPAWK